MISNAEFQAISELDLTTIKTKLMHLPSGEGWSSAMADAVEREYRRFLYLMKMFPEEATVPTVDVDTFWHYHILDTMKYAADCAQVFGYFLHHNPSVGLDEGEEQARIDGATQMQALYAATFGEQDATAGSAYCSRAQAAGEAVYCSAAKEASAYCSRATAAYCSRTAAAAYCSRTAAAYCSRAATAAYCSRTTAAAYCSAAKPATAYCSAAKPSAAYCSAAKSAAAYCSAANSASAYCSVGKPAAAYCSVAKPALAYCSATTVSAQPAHCAESALPLTA